MEASVQPREALLSQVHKWIWQVLSAYQRCTKRNLTSLVLFLHLLLTQHRCKWAWRGAKNQLKGSVCWVTEGTTMCAIRAHTNVLRSSLLHTLWEMKPCWQGCKLLGHLPEGNIKSKSSKNGDAVAQCSLRHCFPSSFLWCFFSFYYDCWLVLFLRHYLVAQSSSA